MNVYFHLKSKFEFENSTKMQKIVSTLKTKLEIWMVVKYIREMTEEKIGS